MSAAGAATVRVLAVDGSPTGGGRTRAALDAVSSAAAVGGASVETVALAGEDAAADHAIAALGRVDAVVLASPVYRASHATPLKQLLDAVPRSGMAPPDSPLSGKAVAIVYTGASLHHFLALDPLRSLLAGFFAAHVVPPGLFVPREGFDGDGALVEPYADQARLQGAALVELAKALRESSLLRSLRPQA